MDKKEVIKDLIFKKAFGSKTFTESDIKRKVIHTLKNVCGIPEHEIGLYLTLKDNRGTVYFKLDDSNPDQPYLPVKLADKKTSGYDVKVGIPAILEAYTENKSRKSTLQLILFLFQIKLKEEFEEVLFGEVIDSDILNLFKNYNKEIKGGSERREDVLFLIVDLLSESSTKSATIVTNDIHFTFNIITTLIKFIHSGKELWLLFDPASVSDLISFRLYTLMKIGVHIKILPIKNRYPSFGVIPNWTPLSNEKDIDSIYKIIKFKTFFFEKEEGNNYSKIITNHTEIKRIVNNIIDYDQGVGDNYPRKLKSESLVLNQINPDDYCKFLTSVFNYQDELNTDKDKIVVYKNAEFSIEVLDIDDIYRRSESITMYKAMQSYHFIDYFKNTMFNINNKTSTVDFIPYNINIIDTIFPINIPFIEYNESQKRYEVGEGHTRLWVLYNMYNIKKIRTIVVKNIRQEYFEPSQSKINKKAIYPDLNFSNKWDHRDYKCKPYHSNHDEHLLDSRNIESITHKIPSEKFVELFNILVNENILLESDKDYSRILTEYFKKMEQS